jgi:hypothetical protein
MRLAFHPARGLVEHERETAMRRDVRGEGVRLSELDLVVNEPFGWPGPLRLSSDGAPVPTWFAWAALGVVSLYGAISAARYCDAAWSAGMFAFTSVAGLLAWRFQQEGVWVDAEGLTARDLFRTVRIPWPDAGDILADRRASRSHTWVERTDGRLVLLPHVSSKDAAYGDAGLRQDLQLLANWWQTGQRRAAGPPG